MSECPDEEIGEIELEPDGSLGMDTLHSEFGEGVTGLSHINPATGNRRIVSVEGKSLQPPDGKWWDCVYYELGASEV